MNGDGIWVMCYSIVMLNTDLHNPAIKKKMTLEEYIKLTSDAPDTKHLPRYTLFVNSVTSFVFHN